MTSVTTPLETRPRDSRARVRPTATLLLVTAGLESTFGIALLMAPSWVARMLAGMEHTSPETSVVLRVAGGIALAIGAWCVLGRLSETGLRRSRPLDLVPGLVVFNGCAVAVIADAIMRHVRAPLLWPALLLHATLLVWCVVCLARERAARPQAR